MPFKIRAEGLAYYKRYYRKNRIRISKRNAVYRLHNQSKIAKRKLIEYKNNRSQILKRCAIYYKKNRLRLVEEKAVYRKTAAGCYTILIRNHKRIQKREKSKKEPMTLLQYKTLFRCPCCYCGNISIEVHGVGLDRINNRCGYTLANVLPACRSCNVWRNNRHTIQETLDHFKPMREAAKAHRGDA